MMKQPGLCHPQFSSFLPHRTHQTLKDVFVNILVNGLALWQEFWMNNSMNIKENNQHNLNFGIEQPCFLGSW